MFWLYWGITATQIILWKRLRVDVILVCAKEAWVQSPYYKAFLYKIWCQLMTDNCRRAWIPGAQSPGRLNFVQYVSTWHNSWPCLLLDQTSSSSYQLLYLQFTLCLTVRPLSQSNSHGINTLLHDRLPLCLNKFAYEQENFTRLYRNKWKKLHFKQQYLVKLMLNWTVLINSNIAINCGIIINPCKPWDFMHNWFPSTPCLMNPQS
jgi:hypothetical protein